MLNLKLNEPIRNLAGEAMRVSDESDETLTLGGAAEIALLATFRDEQDLAAAEKVKRFKLANRLHGAETIDLETEDVALVKKLIGKAFPAIVVGRAYEIIESPAQRRAGKEKGAG